MKIKNKCHPLNEYFYLIEHKNTMNEPFDVIPLDFVLENEKYFNNAFLYLKESDYPLIKKHESFKAISYYLKNYAICNEEMVDWIKIMISKRVRIRELEKYEIISKIDNEFAYEILLSVGYCVKTEYKSNICYDLKNYKKLALNDFAYLEEIGLKYGNYTPYIIKWFYENGASAKNNQNASLTRQITKQHKISPNFFSSLFLNVQPPRVFKDDIDNNLANFLDDKSLLFYLYNNYSKKPDNWIDSFFIETKRKIKHVREFILEYRYVPEKVSDFLSNIAKYINLDFDIFFEGGIDYRKYESFFSKITYINHKIIIDEERIAYFYEYPFYRKFFYRQFDPLNYEKAIEKNFLLKYCFNRPDVKFYVGLTEDVRNSIDPIYCRSDILKSHKKYPRDYFKSFSIPTSSLLHTKLGILFIELNLHKLNDDLIKCILEDNRNKTHELNYYIDKFIWFNCKNPIIHVKSFKTIHDKTLINIILKKPASIEMHEYLHYKDCKNECIQHIIDNKSLEEIVDFLDHDESFTIECLRQKIKLDLLENYKILYCKAYNKPQVMSDVVKDLQNIRVIFDFLMGDFEKNKKILFLLLNDHIEYFDEFVNNFNGKCNLDEARKIFNLKKLCNDKSTNQCYAKSKSYEDLDELCFALSLLEDPLSVVKSCKELKTLLFIYDFYEPYIFHYIDFILSNCSTEMGRECLKHIFSNKFLLYALSGNIIKYLKGNFNKVILEYMNNKDGYFTDVLFELTKTISFSDKAYSIIKTTECEDFVKLNSKEMVEQMIETTFEYYFDEVTESILFYKIREVMHEVNINKVEIELGKKILKIIEGLEHLCLSNNYLSLSDSIFILLNDDRFLNEIIGIFEKWSLCDKRIINGLVDRLESNPRISKVLVSILCKLEKEEPDYVSDICNQVLFNESVSETIPKSAFNFIAYAPALRAFKKHRNDYINILKDIYITKDYEVAERAFIKMIDDDIKRFIIDACFNQNKRFELLSLVQKVIENHKDNIFFCAFYLLKFDKTEKNRHKANELWITHFRPGLVQTVLDELIVFLMYSSKNQDLFELCIDEIIDKYDELLEPKIKHILQQKGMVLEDHILFDGKDEMERVEIIKQNLVFILHRAIQRNKFVELALEYSRSFIDEGLIKGLATKKLYIDKVIDIILHNKLEYEFILQNSLFIDKIYLKTLDPSLISFLSDSLKMKIISTENVDLIFQNFKPTKDWEYFLVSQSPALIYKYLLLQVPDFSQLKTLYEKVLSNYEDVDNLVDIFYIEYLKECTFRNIKDKRKLLNVLMEGKMYRRINELIDWLNDDDICILLRVGLTRQDVRELFENIKSNDMVLVDYISMVKGSLGGS